MNKKIKNVAGALATVGGVFIGGYGTYFIAEKMGITTPSQSKEISYNPSLKAEESHTLYFNDLIEERSEKLKLAEQSSIDALVDGTYDDEEIERTINLYKEARELNSASPESENSDDSPKKNIWVTLSIFSLAGIGCSYMISKFNDNKKKTGFYILDFLVKQVYKK